jgi:hypothetical protein
MCNLLKFDLLNHLNALKKMVFRDLTNIRTACGGDAR